MVCLADMKICILLHSTTGNTKVVTEYAASWLRRAGHECVVHDILEHPAEIPPVEGIDLLGVACPTMYFRPTWGMERAVARMPNTKGDRVPAFLLGTCAGEPGAHFALLSELLVHKGYVALAAHWVIAPSNYPLHLHWMRSLGGSTPIGTWLNHVSRSLRPVWGTIWPASLTPDEDDRRQLERFLDAMLSKVGEGDLDQAPTPDELNHSFPTTNPIGRIFPREILDLYASMHLDAERCSHCGSCVSACPVGVIVQPDPDEAPRVCRGCTGCCACYNLCPEGCFSLFGFEPGVGRYQGPPLVMREVFRASEE
jgi:hypothetical protein